MHNEKIDKWFQVYFPKAVESTRAGQQYIYVVE